MDTEKEMEFYNFDDDCFPKYNGIDDSSRNTIITNAFYNAENLYDIICEGFDYKNPYMKNKKECLYYSFIGLDCELYIKLLYYCTQGNTKFVSGGQGHDICSLFEDLPDELKDDIQKRVGYEKDFDKNLRKLGEVFSKFRYSYELKGYKGDIEFAALLMNCLRDVCRESISFIDDDGNWIQSCYVENNMIYPHSLN